MAMKPLPCPTVLRQLLRYEPETGKMFYRTAPEWMFDDGPKLAANKRCSKWNKNNAGKLAFSTKHPIGYLVGAVFGRKIYAHRAAWAVQHGEWPAAEVDHKNGCRTDNRLSNLRSVTKAENTRNKFMSSRNASGYTGVAWREDTQKWRAHIGADGKTLHLGVFETLQDALRARKAAEAERGFSKRHGTTR